MDVAIPFGLLRCHDAGPVAPFRAEGIGMPFKTKPIHASSVPGTCPAWVNIRRRPAKSACAQRMAGAGPVESASCPRHPHMFRQAVQSLTYVTNLPTFGNSDDHVGLLVHKVVCSTLFSPSSALVVAPGRVNQLHLQPRRCGASGLPSRSVDGSSALRSERRSRSLLRWARVSPTTLATATTR